MALTITMLNLTEFINSVPTFKKTRRIFVVCGLMSHDTLQLVTTSKATQLHNTEKPLQPNNQTIHTARAVKTSNLIHRIFVTQITRLIN